MSNLGHSPLRLVTSAGPIPPLREGIRLPPSPRLDDFLAAAANEGLEPSEATRLAIERFFALADAAALGIGVEASRRLLDETAQRARPNHSPPTREASRVRELAIRRPVAQLSAGSGLEVAVPERLLTRIGKRIPARTLHAEFVPEMVRWELAAALEGRTMGEWALRTLALATVA
jgi:hypothetical protein